MQKIRLCSELVYLGAIVLLAFAVAMIASASFGVSMIVAPAYVLSQRLVTVTFGQCEYILQAGVFVLFCVLMRGVKLVYFSSFLTCLLYGAVLDLWRALVPAFNPAVTVPGSMALPVRIVFFAVGMALTTFSVALFFRTYLYPQVYDFFVKGVSARYGISRVKFKTCFDAVCLVSASAMSLLFFQKLVGIGVGTLIMTCCNGTVIGWFGDRLDERFEFVPLFPRFAARFRLN